MGEDLFRDGKTGYAIIWNIIDELGREISPNYRRQIIKRGREVVSQIPNEESRALYQEGLENAINKSSQ